MILSQNIINITYMQHIDRENLVKLGSDDFPEAAAAYGDARSAQHAVIRMPAYLRAGSAMGARGFADHDLPLRRKTLRIMAPLTAQRASFHKNRRPDARSVKHGKFLDVKYDPCHTCSSARRMI